MLVNLISPRPPVAGATNRERALMFSRLGLATVAALFPKEAQVRIINDGIETVDFDEKVDLVGITAMTSTAPRAYEIADGFRERGVPVILGGIHPTALPQEASSHADSVVIGEAEGVMDDVAEDLKLGRLKKFYQTANRPSLAGLPLPKRDLLNGNRYYAEWDMIQTTRGCPFRCDFCSVSEFFGRTYRTRPVEDVVEEVKSLGNRRAIFFVDDNIAARPAYTRKLLKALIPLRVKWFGQGCVLMARDRELLNLLRESGCFGLFIGFESLSGRSLEQVNKGTNHVRDYGTAIKKIHDSGIGVVGAFIFGFDSDDEGVFEETVRFIDRHQVELASFSILTPLPGTRLYRQMHDQGRIVERDWAKYTCGEVVFRPKLLSIEELQDGYYWARKHTSSYRSILLRTLRPRKTALMALPINLTMRKGSRGFLKAVNNSSEA